MKYLMAILMGAQMKGREQGWWMRLWRALAELRQGRDLRDLDSDASILASKLTPDLQTV